MRKSALVLTGMSALMLGGACAERTGEVRGSTAWNTADANLRRRVRLNRGFYNLVGQHARLSSVCPYGVSNVRTKSNGWDALLSFATIGLYTPQHSYIVCNPTPTSG